jgi:hypothetical protein
VPTASNALPGSQLQQRCHSYVYNDEEDEVSSTAGATHMRLANDSLTVGNTAGAYVGGVPFSSNGGGGGCGRREEPGGIWAMPRAELLRRLVVVVRVHDLFMAAFQKKKVPSQPYLLSCPMCVVNPLKV